MPAIVDFYKGKVDLALCSKDKPIMDNKCSRGHSLHNHTLIHKGKIILGTKKVANQLFKSSDRTKKILTTL